MNRESGTSSAPLPAAPVEPAAVDVPREVLTRVHGLYLCGLNLDALAATREIAPLHQWAGADAMVLAGRLAGNLGGMRLAGWLHIRAWKRHPDSARARYYYTRTVLDRKGPYGAWRFHQSQPLPPEDQPHLLADWLAMGASLTGMLRDFGTAELLIRNALQLAPRRPWICVERAFLLQSQDRHEEALEWARRSLELRAWYRPGVQTAAQLLATLNRDEEALALLDEAARRTQSAPITSQLATMLGEMRHYERARTLWERVVELSPLADRDFKKYLCARRCDAACDCGDFPAAAELARGAGRGFFENIAANLSRDLAGRTKVELDVPFVQQHHMTCAPATLAAVSRFWGRDARHLEIVEAICYDGTPAHSERAWAEQHGYACREFRVTWDAAVALINCGIPFTLVTAETTSAHLQAVIGYDARRGTLLIRDPSCKFSSEVLAEGLAERYKSVGPRGMALVPVEEAHRFDGLHLPENDLYDLFYRVQKSLVGHRRQEAVAAIAGMEQHDAGHRLTIWARRSLANYDADVEAQLRETDALLKRFPDDTPLQLQKVVMLRNLARRSDILATLEVACARPGRDPIFLQYLAEDLGMDPRQFPRARKLLERSIRCRPTEPSAYAILGNLLWQKRDFETATELYRFATCLNDKDDQYAISWFNASRHFKRTDDAIAMLRDRFVRFGGRSGTPARTLFRVLATVDRANEGFELLEEALARRPTDGDLLLFAADASARYGNTPRAVELLERARGNVHAAMYRRAQASLAQYRGELAAALAIWQEVLEDEPLALDAHEAVAQLLGETRGREAAQAHLEQACVRFEHNYPLQQLYLNWLRADNVPEMTRVVQKLLEYRPGDAWLVREHAICLSRLGEIDAAVTAIREALRLEPQHTCGHSIASRVYAAAGALDDAMDEARQALVLAIDNDDAMNLLLDLCATVPQRKHALQFIAGQLVEQVTYGDGLLAFRVLANQTLDGEQTLQTLSDALDARPDLWQAWSGKIHQLIDLNCLEEARDLAQRAVEQFPLQTRLWLDLASAQSLLGDSAGEAASLDKAVSISPGWGPALRALSDSRCRAGDYPDARRILQNGIAWAPLDAMNYGALAEVLWKLGERTEAVEHLRRSLRLSPGYDWAWAMLRQWGPEVNEPTAAIDLARDLTQRRAGEARSWYTLARVLEGDQALEEQLAALARACELEPLNYEHYSYRAYLLARAGQYDQAEAACRPEVFGDSLPVPLRGRSAWVWAQRGEHDRAIAELEKVVADDPRFVWGWTMLAEWNRDRGINQGYLQAGQALTHLTPVDPSAWCYLGEAQDRAGNTAAAAEAYRHAITLDPTWAPATRRLADLHARDRDFAAARRVLEAGLVCAPGDPAIHGTLAEVCWQQEQKAAAIDYLKKAVHLAVGYEWAWSMLREWGPKAGQDDVAVDTARELAAQRPGQVTPWFVLARMLESRNTPDESLEALRRAEEIDPRDADIHDFRAYLLSKHRRYDDAIAACAPAALPDPPSLLRARAAWVHAERGDIHRAIADMQKVVNRDRRYLWGWSLLTQWHREAGTEQEYHDAAKQLVHLAPTDAVSWGHWGEALARAGNKKEACEAFERALSLDGAYTFGALSLCDLRLEAEQLEGAEKALTLLAKNERPGTAGSRWVRLRIKQGRRADAGAEFEKLVALPDVRIESLRAACGALGDAGWDSEVKVILERAIDADGTAAAGDCWAGWMVTRNDWEAIDYAFGRWIQPATPLRPAVRSAVCQYVDELARANQIRRFDRFLRQRRATILADDLCWGTVGGALVRLDRFKQCAMWLADWSARPGLQPWMLVNLATSLMVLKRYAQMLDVATAGLSLAGDDREPVLRICAGLVQAWFGDLGQARAHQQQLAIASPTSFEDFLAGMLNALVVSADDETERFIQSRRILLETARRHPEMRKDSIARAACWQTVRTIASRRGGIRARWWGWSKSLALAMGMEIS